MAFFAPQLLGPDGVLRELEIFSTTMDTRFFTGVIGNDTVDMEVSVRGGGFTNDTDFIIFEGTTFRIPNPDVFPDGLELAAGENRIQVRAISATGSVSPTSTSLVRLIQESDLGTVAVVPTNISVLQKDATVEISVERVDDPNLRGFNFYASPFEGGGVTGYSRINLNTVIAGTAVQEVDDVSTIEVDALIPLDQAGQPLADPLYVRIQGDQEDETGNVLQVDYNERVEIPETARAVRYTIQVDTIRDTEFFSFEHLRTGGPTTIPQTVASGAFAAVPDSDPLYYVVVAVFYDQEALVEFESSFSAEVVGHPLRIRPNVGNFPQVSRQQIVRGTIQSIFRSNPQIRVDAGAPFRDTFIDPFAAEAERIRFIVDFLHRAQTFAGLEAIDDPNDTGTSTPVSQSSYKQALRVVFNLNRDAEVQSLIDRAFEALASNFGIFRLPGRFSRGEVQFFTTVRPKRTLPIPLGSVVTSGSIQFRTTQASSIPFDRLASFFDPVTGRYFVLVSVQATTTGSSGNVGVGQVRSVVSGTSGLSVINNSSMFGGTNQETNRQLAERARNALASVDSGTKRGYLQTAADVPGVVQAVVVGAGDALMQRDLDSQGVHRGGKVDIWVQGENLANVTDVFAFTFELASDIQFELVSVPSELRFRANDPELSLENPIVEMLDDPALGFEFRNATTGAAFDLSGVAIVSFDTIQLNTAIPQPPVDLTDVVLGDYRRRSSTEYIFVRQPVRAVSSVTGSVSGLLTEDAYSLNIPKSPLGEGRSGLAGDFLRITGTTDSDGNLVPSGDLLTVTDETHVLIGEFNESVDNLGANFLSVAVLNADRTITYKGPSDPSGLQDYTIVPGDQTTPLAIRRIVGGAIPSGTTVSVDYQHDENFTVAYTTNLIVQVTQEEVNEKRHVTADVIVKDGINVPVDLAATVVLVTGAIQSDVDTALRTNLENFFNALRLGDPVRQSDIIEVLDGTTDVSFVVVPLTTMVRGAGSTVVREVLASGILADSDYISAWSTPTVSVWLIRDGLSAATTTGGGPENEFQAVFQDDVETTLLRVTPSALGVASGRSFIIGSGGLSIPGFTDDATLVAEGFDTQAEREAVRTTRTANRVLISTGVDDSPVNHEYAITYIVTTEERVYNIEPGAAEFLTLGDLTLTFDEDR